MPINDPIAWWKLDDGIGTAAVDSSGNAYNLTLTDAPTWILDGQIAGALRVDGISQKGESSAAGLLASLQGSNTFTVAFWARAAAFQANAAGFAIRDGVDTNKLLIIYPYDDGGGDPRVFWNGNNILNIGGPALSLDTWHHFVFVSRSATEHELLVDDVSIGVDTTSITNSATLSHVTVGAWNGGQFISADFDEVRVYDRALTAGEITELFEFTGPPPVVFPRPSGPSSGKRQQPHPQQWWKPYLEQQEIEWAQQEKEQRRLKAIADAVVAEQRLQEIIFNNRLKREQEAIEAAAAAERKRLQAERREERIERAKVINPENSYEDRFKAATGLLNKKGWKVKDE